MKVVISGASGFIGTHLSNFLCTQGYEVWKLKREKPVRNKEIFWDPYSKVIEKEKLEGTNIFINLSGENIGSKFWTKHRKEVLVKSRLIPSKFLVEVIIQMTRKPEFYFATSAIGIYGPVVKDVQNENYPMGTGFLANLCKEWERTAEPLKNSTINTVIMRFGVVFGNGGGMLEKLLKIYNWYFGGVVGDKKAYISWIAIEDLCEAIHFLISKGQISGGAYNFVSPEPVTQEDLAKVLSKLTRKPSYFSVPPLLIRMLLGDMGRELILADQKVFPAKLIEEGYKFKNSELSCYLNKVLNKK